MNFLQWNRRYIGLINTGDPEQATEFFNELMADVKNPFRKRRYLWNRIRGKGFYTLLARWIVETVNAGLESVETSKQESETREIDQRFSLVISVLHEVMVTENNANQRKSLIWNITKHVALLTIDTVPYLSRERYLNLLRGNRPVITDQAMSPVVDEVKRLRDELEKSNAIIEGLTNFVTDDV